MTRYRLVVEYDGTGFVGWQRQENLHSVQGVLEAAIQAFSGEAATVFAAGRTDAGVHARGQVVHFDLARPHSPSTIRNALNFYLRLEAVAVVEAAEAAPGFHARFDATGRAYRYRILNRRAPPALDRAHVWHVPKPLDIAAMQEGARHLVGRHDFTTFRATQCQAPSPVKTLDLLEVRRDGDYIDVFAEARSFLHNQVRAMVGTLKDVGEGRWHPDEVARARDARDRTRCGMTAPPTGLVLMRVDYGPRPEEDATTA